MLDHVFLNRKISLLQGYISDLEQLVKNIPADFNSIEKDRLQLIERRFQLVVDAMTDINIHLIKEGSLGDPDDIQSTFKILGQNKVLDDDFGNKIAPVVGVRNMLIHQYEKLDKSLFLRNLKRNFKDFGTYLTQITTYVNNN